MDFNYTTEQKQFRSELRGWLEKNSAEIFGADGRGYGDSIEGMIFSRDDKEWSRVLEYHRRLYKAGYLALHWPKEWGGGGAGLVEQSIYQDEVLRLGLPLYGANMLAVDRIGPTIMLLGTEQQKKRFLHAMLTADEIWCQGYSEPNAGSDLAGLTTRAVLDGDSFVVNGQKVWTSMAHRADWQCLLVRTDPSAPKHKGISYLLVNMKSPGITIRPLVQITGESKFNEVFYDNVRVPKENLVGELNDGWRVSVAMLMFQRLSAGTRFPMQATINELIALTRRIEFAGMPAAQHPYVRQKIAEFASEAECLRLGRYRTLSAMLRGKPPGPENSLAKLCSSELQLSIMSFVNEMLGAYGPLERESNLLGTAVWTERMMNAREYTIAGGTSQIQHNIIGERVLGLAKG